MAGLDQIIAEHSGPPVNIEAIIRALGLRLDKKADLDHQISGVIERTDDGSYKISANKEDHYFRRRFTMAHELGHYLYHAHLLGEGVDDNQAYRSSEDGPYANPNIGKREETEANRFAAMVLMPSDKVRAEWQRLRDPENLAKKFQVSKQAMEIRLKSLGIDPT
jgi:Zn-dependent peptidase ImmA (M78 family)